jgi:hypothetical protein
MLSEKGKAIQCDYSLSINHLGREYLIGYSTVVMPNNGIMLVTVAMVDLGKGEALILI